MNVIPLRNMKMSEVETLWSALSLKWPKPLKPWNELNPQSQMMVVQAINIMIQVCQIEEKK